MKILVLHPGALGDIILSLPTLALIRARRPDAGLTIAANLDFLSAVSHGYAERSMSLSTVPLHRLGSGGPPAEEDTRFWSSFDVVLSWTGSADPEFASSLRTVNPNSYVGRWRPAPGETRHVSRLFASILAQWLEPEPTPGPPVVEVPARARAAAREWLEERNWSPGRRLVAIHAGAGSAAKRWDLSRFIEGASALASGAGFRILALEGPADCGVSDRILGACPPGAVVQARGLPLPLVAGVLQHCSGYLGNDSGVSHLAAALGLRSLVLFGPTRPDLWGPTGSHVRVLHRPEGCAACSGSDGSAHTCLENIGVAEVAACLRDMMH